MNKIDKIYKWYRGGKPFKDTLDPEGETLSVEYFPNNVKIDYYYDILGFYHYRKSYIKDERLHREDGPAIIWYRDDGSIQSEHYFKNGHYHNVKGPALIEYDTDGTVTRRDYYQNGSYMGNRRDFRA